MLATVLSSTVLPSVVGWVVGGALLWFLLAAMGVVDAPMSVTKQREMFRYIPLNKIHTHSRNPRNKAAYAATNPKMVRLLADMADGWSPDHPATVFPRRDADGNRLNDGTYEFGIGNRRGEAARRLGLDFIPCIVIEHYSHDEEIKALHDHAQVEGLDSGEELTAFRDLDRQNLSGRIIAIRLGWFSKDGKPNLNKINEYRGLCKLPTAVQEEWVRYRTGGKDECTFVPTTDNLKKLSNAIASDAASGHHGLPEDGEKYRDVLAELRGAKKEEPQNHASKKAMSTAMQGEQDSAILRNFLGVIAGEVKGITYGDMCDVIRWMDREVFGLRSRMPMTRPTVLDKIFPPAKAEPETATTEPEAVVVDDDDVPTDEAGKKKLPKPVKSKR